MLTPRAPLSPTDRALLDAAAEGSLVKLRMMLWRTTRLNVRDNRGNTALLLACENALNNEQAAILLAERPEVDVNARNRAGATALHKLAVRGDTRVVQALLQASANPLALDRAGKSPAHRYLEHGFHAGLETLLDHFYRPRLLIDQTDGDGNTLLHLAAQRDPSLLPDLLARGGNACLRNAAGALPEDVCTEPMPKKLLVALRRSTESNRAKAQAGQAAQAAQRSPAPEPDPEAESLLDSARRALDFIHASTPKPAPQPD